MPRDYDREYEQERYERREYPRPRLYDEPEEGRYPSEGADRAAFQPRRPYLDREIPPERKGRKAEDPAYDFASAGNVTITSPKSFFDVQDMIDKLRRSESIIVNLEGLEADSAQRILDFLSGAAYAIGGSMRRVKEMHSTFLVTPQGTGITDTNDDRYPR